MRTAIRSWLLFGPALLAAGCALPSRDVSFNQQYRTDYVSGQVYALKRAVLLERSSATSPECCLKNPRQIYPLMDSITEWQRHPSRWPRVLGVMEAGTRIRIVKIVREDYVALDTRCIVQAEVLDGRFRGRLVSLNWVSKQVEQPKPFARIPWVDPEQLDVVEEPQSK